MWASAYLFQSLHILYHIISHGILVVLLKGPLTLISTLAHCAALAVNSVHTHTITLITSCSRLRPQPYNVHGLQAECVGMSLDLMPIPARGWVINVCADKRNWIMSEWVENAFAGSANRRSPNGNACQWPFHHFDYHPSAVSSQREIMRIPAIIYSEWYISAAYKLK